MNAALATVRAAPGLDEYLELLEERLEDVVAGHRGRVSELAVETLGAGGKRLRPVLVFLATPPDLRTAERAVAGGAAVELVHMATLVHDDLLDRADLRRGRPTVWAGHGEAAAKATGDYLFARAFAQLAATGDARAVAVLVEAALALARGEALQRRQAFRPDTSVDEYLLRCSLKTGKLFEAACLLGGGGRSLGAFGLALGIAFQIADDILDCTGDEHATGKAGGVDLRDGTPTLPLIVAARRDPFVRRALAGEVVPGALGRVAASGALETARELALRYAARARAALDGEPERASLEALTHLVVDRDA
ncbi:MAG TPA: polyprenyl synthetase family protein [Gaiellaceae bacterium]|nr:polyprenyl synthetase family protein [Gaiellaceae bacterium]